MIDILKKCNTDLRYINNDYLTILFTTLKVQDKHYPFSKVFPSSFFAILFFEVPMWSTCLCHSKVTIPQKQRASESSNSRRVLNPKVHVTTLITFGTLRSTFKVTCPALKSTCPRPLDGTFFKPCLKGCHLFPSAKLTFSSQWLSQDISLFFHEISLSLEISVHKSLSLFNFQGKKNSKWHEQDSILEHWSASL